MTEVLLRHEVPPKGAIPVRPLLLRLLDDDRGQDLIEYVLLTATIGVAGIAFWPVIAASIGTTYTALDQNTQGLWIPPNPGGGS